MNVTTENLSRPGEAPQEGDWVRVTTDYGNGQVVVVEREFHAPPEEP